MHRHRGWAIVGVGLLGGCFKELPTLPGDAETTSETDDATASPTTTGAGASTGTGVASEPQTSDADLSSTGPAPAAAEGLFACVPAVCEPWLLPACDGDCGPLDAAGRCALERMRDRGEGRVDARACADGCERAAVAVRGGGTDEARLQTASEVGEALGEHSDVLGCVLREPAFFDGCLAGLTAACVDPTQWFATCAEPATACE